MSESDNVAYVTTTSGFEDPTEGSPYIMIGNEWVKCKKKDRRRFVIAKRGVRGTARAAHETATKVRVGTTLVLRVYVPAYREDWSSMRDFLEKVRTK